ncbi:MAG: FkbM family methyltransferase [Chlamydiae bacterium]|nr:FkbM family methyltransferase [Chlamydiota bacterium]
MDVSQFSSLWKESGIIFIQIGANEGVMSNDFLHPFILEKKWKGILIEPVPSIFKKLQKNYAHIPNLHFENVAISDRKKQAEFFVVDSETEFFKNNPGLVNQAGGPWGDQKGSLDRDHVVKHSSAISDVQYKSISVQCLTFQDIIEKYQLPKVDLLQMDTEGHDDVILLSIDYAKIAPRLIIFEHEHLSFERYFACITHLQSFGYEVAYTGVYDTVIMRTIA